MSMLRTFSMMLGEIDFMNTFVYPYFNDEPADGAVRTLPFPNTTFSEWGGPQQHLQWVRWLLTPHSVSEVVSNTTFSEWGGS